MGKVFWLCVMEETQLFGEIKKPEAIDDSLSRKGRASVASCYVNDIASSVSKYIVNTACTAFSFLEVLKTKV
jgi:hypothetical protein